LSLVVFIGALALLTATPSGFATALIPEPVAAQHGLTRAWTAQVQVDPTRGQLRNIILDSGTIFAQTDEGTLEAIDAGTGKRLWAAQVGDHAYPTFAPAANPRLVALINGSMLYVLNRFNGKQLWKMRLQGSPSAGPALSFQRVYAPLSDGMIVSYELKPEEPLKDREKAIQETSPTPEQTAAREAEQRDSLRLKQDKEPPLTCRGPGRPLVAPLVTRQNPDEEYVAWTTDRGSLCVGRVDRTRQRGFSLLYSLQTEAPISSQPTYLPADLSNAGDSGVIIAASQDGYVHAVRERDGNHVWRFATGSPVVDNPVVLGRFVLVTNQLGGLFCLDVANLGSQVWWAPDVTQVIAASKQRVYTADKTGRLQVLDGKSGAVVDTLSTEPLPIKLTNGETDRMFLASTTGLIQCLHEIGLSEPLVRRLPPKEELASAAEAKPKAESSDDASPTLSSPPTTGSLPRPASKGTGVGPAPKGKAGGRPPRRQAEGIAPRKSGNRNKGQNANPPQGQGAGAGAGGGQGLAPAPGG
jgi:outer membrane protein assembly factor BamB